MAEDNKDARKSLLFYTGVLLSGLSILSIIQDIFTNYSFLPIFKYVIDQYKILTSFISFLLRPLIDPIFSWMEKIFAVNLDLGAHWQPVFVLSFLPVIGMMQLLWWRNDKKIHAILIFPFLLIGTTLGSAVAGAIPLSGGWLNHGLIALTPTLGQELAILIFWSLMHFPAKDIARTSIYMRNNEIFGIAKPQKIAYVWNIIPLFLIGAGISQIPGFENSAGPLVILLFFLVKGLRQIFSSTSLRFKGFNYHLGLSMIGGFVVTLIVFIANSAISFFS